MTNFARSERRSLAALLRTLGPDAPTLCEGWDARDLAVHLVIRDRRPGALIGNAMPGVLALQVASRPSKTHHRSVRERSRAVASIVGG